MHFWKALLLGGCLGLCGCSARPAGAAGVDVPASRSHVARNVAVVVGRLAAPELTENSGLAASRLTNGLSWAVNDSGNEPELFSLGSHGEDRGKVRVAGVENHDWEDLAAFTWQGRAFLLVADVGDNRAERAQVQLHIVPEPLPGPDGRFAGSVNPAWSIKLVFEDGPRDCEGVAVDEAGGQILLLSKRTTPPVLYRVPLRPAEPDKVQAAKRIAEIRNIPAPTSEDLQQPFGAFRSWPTALDIRPDGSAMVILTYKDAYLYPRRGDETWSTTLSRAPRILHLPPSDQLPQRESICFISDGSILVTSEGRGAPLFKLATGGGL